MNEKTVMLKSYRKEIEVLSLEVEVPTSYGDERDKYLYKYEDLLLKLFNNKRDDKDILKIENYAGNNYIRIFINFTNYVGNNGDREECVEHLKRWFTANMDIADKDIEVEFSKGFIYEVPEWENKIEGFEKNGEDYKIIHNYIEWED